MSRLFDALKSATGFRQGAEGKAVEEVWTTLGIDGQDMPQVLTDSDIMLTSAANPMEDLELAFQEDLAIEPSSAAQDESEVQTSDSFGILTKLAIDRKTRLIPRAADPIVAEHYRKLRTKIIQQQAEKPFRSLVVTSAESQEGKTLTVLNLGLSFAMLPSLSVLVVDGDMRTGTLGNWLGVDDKRPGLSNLIDGSAQLDEVVLKSDELPLHVIVRGNTHVPDLHSHQLARHLGDMAERFDLVLVDTPPVNLIADVQLLAGSCDAVLLVARAFQTSRKAFERAVQELRPFRVIGTVLNAGTAQRYRKNY